MPRPHVIFTEFHKRELFLKVSIRVGFPILRKADCKKVGELIVKSGFSGISESTIYRLFLWKGNTNSPYLHTLDILAQFCGFNDWIDFDTHIQKLDSLVRGFGRFDNSNPFFNSLITICIHDKTFKPLQTYTEQFQEIEDNEIKYKYAEEIFKSTLTNKDNTLFFKNFCHFEIIRSYFFELLADPTFSIPNYEDGIKFYLKEVKFENSLKELQDFIFGNCMLFRHYYLSHQYEKARKIAKIIFEDFHLTEQQMNEIHVFPVARYLGCKLMYLDIKQSLNETLDFIEKLKSYLRGRITILSRHEQAFIFYNLGEAYLLNAFITPAHHNQLKELFVSLFDDFPGYLFHEKLEKMLPYFNKNGSFFMHSSKSLEIS